MATEVKSPTNGTAPRISVSSADQNQDERSASTSSSNNRSSSFSEDPAEHTENWSRTTHEKDSWATKERRRNQKFSAFDRDMQLQEIERRNRKNRVASSMIGLFQPGVDKGGNASILSDDHHDDIDVAVLVEEKPPVLVEMKLPPDDVRRLSMASQESDKRRGSVLGIWRRGKDSKGNALLHSGYEPGDEEAVFDDSALGDSSSETLSTSPTVDPRGDRRGSILSIWKQAKDKSGNSIILSGNLKDHQEEPHEDDEGIGADAETRSAAEKGKGPEVKDNRQGSILSMWEHTKDKDGKSLMMSGEEYDDEEHAVEVAKGPPPKKKERKGSILSMWSEDKEEDEQHRPGKVKLNLVHEE